MAAVLLRVEALEPVCDRGQVRGTCPEVRSRRQAPHDREHVHAPPADRIAGKLMEALRDEHVHLAPQGRHEGRRQDPDDDAGLAVEGDGTIDGTRVAAEDALPRAVREDGCAGGSVTFVTRFEHAAAGRADSEDVEERSRDAQAGKALGLDRPGQRDPARAQGGERREAGGLLAIVLEVGGRQPPVPTALADVVLVDAHEAFLVEERQGCEQDRVRQCEDRGDRSDPQGQDQDDGPCMDRAPQEGSQRHAHVVRQARHAPLACNRGARSAAWPTPSEPGPHACRTVRSWHGGIPSPEPPTAPNADSLGRGLRAPSVPPRRG